MTDVIDDAEIDTSTGIDIHQWLRGVCITKYQLFLVDQESLFRLMKFVRHKPKASVVSCIQQNFNAIILAQKNRGRHTHQEIWVLRLVYLCS